MQRGWAWLAYNVAVAVVGVTLLFPDAVGLGGVFPFVQLAAARVPLLTLTLVAAALASVLVLLRVVRVRVLVALWIVALVAAGLVLPRAVASPFPGSGGPSLRLLSLNVDNGHADIGSLAAIIERVRPDVVVLPEAGDRFAGALRAAMPKMGFRAAIGGPPRLFDGSTVAVLTAPGITGQATQHEGTRFWWVQLAGGPPPVAIVAVHVAAPVPSQEDKWATDLAALNGWCRSGRPVLIAGDFNSTQDNGKFRQMAGGCQDAAAARGRGLTPTWPSWSPAWLGMQIDHVLVAGGIQVQDAEILTVPGTDHRALSVTLQFPARSSTHTPQFKTP